MNDSIVFTNDNCIGCNKCIKVCSAIGACVSAEEDGRSHITVDGSKCVACGSCIDVCVHGAREFTDDTRRFFEDLKKGEKISVLLAPAFRANYPDEYESVLGGLKAMGVNRIISVSFGADITTWGYLNYIKEHDFVGGISQPCPAVVSYIEHYLPDLIPKLFPVQSPLMCAAIYARKEMGITDRFAFISPCIAKKLEMEDEHNSGLVQYNVTFEHLMDYVKEHGIKGEDVHSEIEYGLGSFYPTPGGLAENVRWFLGDQVYIRQIEGERRLYEWMHINADRIKEQKTPFLFIDALNCEKGCICGTAVNPERSKTDDALYALLDIRERAKRAESGNAWSRNDTPEERLANFNAQFAKLDLEDYLREYTDRSEGCRYEIPEKNRLDEIFASMNKMTEEDRRIDCTCCGYDSCRQMAIAIHNGFNHRENCIHYEKDKVHELEIEKSIAEESERTRNRLLANISHDISAPINAIQGINDMIKSGSDDEKILNYSESITSAVGRLRGFVENLLDLSGNRDTERGEASDEADRSIVIMMFKKSAIVKGIEKKLAALGYEVSSQVSSPEAGEDIADAGLYIIYLPEDIAGSDSQKADLLRIYETLVKKGGRLLLIGEPKSREVLEDELTPVSPFGWADRPVDIDKLDALVKKMLSSQKRRILMIDEDAQRARRRRDELKDEYRVDILTSEKFIDRFFEKIADDDPMEAVFVSDGIKEAAKFAADHERLAHVPVFETGQNTTREDIVKNISSIV